MHPEIYCGLCTTNIGSTITLERRLSQYLSRPSVWRFPEI